MTQVQTGGSFWFQFAHVMPRHVLNARCVIVKDVCVKGHWPQASLA